MRGRAGGRWTEQEESQYACYGGCQYKQKSHPHIQVSLEVNCLCTKWCSSHSAELIFVVNHLWAGRENRGQLISLTVYQQQCPLPLAQHIHTGNWLKQNQTYKSTVFRNTELVCFVCEREKDNLRCQIVQICETEPLLKCQRVWTITKRYFMLN